MENDTITLTPDAVVARQSLIFPYPPGRSSADYARDNISLMVGPTSYSNRPDVFNVSFEPFGIRVTWLSTTRVAANTTWVLAVPLAPTAGGDLVAKAYAPSSLSLNFDLRQRIRRIAAEAQLSNPVDGPVASGVTMTSPATADAALTNTKQAVTSGVVQADAALFRYTGGTATVFPSQSYYLFPVSSIAPATTGNLNGYLTGTPSLSAWSWQVSFMTDADLLEIDFLSFTNTNFRVIVDGAYVSKTATVPNADGTLQRARLDFSSVRKARRITFCSRGATGFRGVRIGPTANLWKPSLVDSLTVAVTGDSYSEGQGLASRFTPDAAWNNVMGRLLGWDDIRQVAVGSTGYLQTAGTRSKIRDQIANWGFTPDIIVCAAGYNDHTTFTPAAIAAEALLAWQAMRAAAPLAPIFILGPWSGQRGNDATTLAMEAALQSTFTSWGDSNAWFIPQCSIAAPYVFGTGRVGSTTSNGNSDVYTSSDGVHPSDAGHEHLGRRAANDIRQIVAAW